MSINQSLWRQAMAALLCSAAMTAGAVTTVSISASPNPVAIGSPVSVSVLIAEAVDLYGFQFSLNFNPALLQAVSGSEGSFLPTGGSTFFGAGTIDNTAGTISFVFDSLVGALPGVSGNGTLATFSFNTVGSGAAVVSFSNTLLLDSALAEIPGSFQPGTVSVGVIPEPSSYALFALGLAGIGTLALRRRAG